MPLNFRRIVPLLALALGLVLLGVALVVTLQPRGSGSPAGAAVGGPFALVAQDGTTVTERDLQGHPTLIFFGFTHCADVCPTTLFELTQVFAALGPEKNVVGLFVSVDPERDTPALLKDYLAAFDPRIRGLSGDAAATAAIRKAYRVYAAKVPLAGGGYNMDHTSMVYLMDKQGQFVNAFNLQRPAAEAARELAGYL